MPRRKKNSKAAKKRFNEQGCSNIGQFNIIDDDYIPSSEYSEDSSDDEFINERIQKLTTKFRKYGPSGKFTQAAKLSQPITNFFNFDNVEIEKESEEKSEDEMEIKKESEKENEEEEMEFEKESEEESEEEEMEFENKSKNKSEEEEMKFENKSENESEEEIEEEIETEKESEEESEKETEEEIETEKESEEESKKETEEENEEEIEEKMEIKKDEHLIKLENILSTNKKKINAYEYLKYRALHLFFKYYKQNNITQIDASLQSAKEIYNKGVYKARQIRNWAKNWIQFGVLPRSLQEYHQKIKSFIDDEDVIEKSLSFICENGGKTTPKEYQTFINQVLFIQMNLQTSKRSISIKTSRIWLKKLGLKPQSRKKGIYFDGHEREDVIKYRKVFLNKMLQYENFMPSFEGENMIQQNPSLLPNEKMHILVTHDECLFYFNDDRPIIWAPIGNPPLRKKGQGKSIMVNEFLLETIGRLKLSEEEIILNPNVPIEARKFLKSGKNEERWWTAEYLLDQVINYAIPIFEVKYPNCISIFAFDNSTNHGAMVKDVLNVNNMNVNPGEKQARMRSTYFGPNKTFQSMIFPSNHPTFSNQPKGMKQVLIERNLWYEGLIGYYQLCKLKIEDIIRTDCCMHRILSLEDDFKAQKSQLQEEIEKKGHIQKGITGKMAEFTVKKYKSHHRVPDSIYNEIQ
ncbi:hypothetical protein C1646_773791 [Rhizophagus diaphanus]|nr:hypothetical protein C1646_773791 [Rhizophagus diaphanus] [Rhizophagus sp. MUCL 43196]